MPMRVGARGRLRPPPDHPCKGRTMAVIQSELVVVGGGLAGRVTALETARAGLSGTLVDRHPPQHFGGLARWAFGGMALVGPPLRARRKHPDSPERAPADWVRCGGPA